MKTFFILGLLAISISSFSQCDILHRVSPDGSMIYYMKPVVFYYTKAKELKGNVETDKENYFLGLQPLPFPGKPDVKKMKEDLEIQLSNGKVYKLSHFDARYLKHDSVMELLYLVDKEHLDELLNFEVTQVKIDMKGKEGIRSYFFKLHKDAIREQLKCFLKEFAGKKKD
jgi:hypothetical protein